MKSVALLARKGGSGKTTCAVHMGVLAQAEGLAVAFIDLDPQRSLTAWWQSREAKAPALLDATGKRLPDVLQTAAKAGYGLVVIDTPPALSFETASVASAVDFVLIPLRPSVLDILAVSGTAEVIAATKTPALLVLNACAPPRGIVEASSTGEARKALEQMGTPIAATSLAQRMDYARALNGGEAVSEFAPGSKAAGEMGRLWDEVKWEMK